MLCTLYFPHITPQSDKLHFKWEEPLEALLWDSSGLSRCHFPAPSWVILFLEMNSAGKETLWDLPLSPDSCCAFLLLKESKSQWKNERKRKKRKKENSTSLVLRESTWTRIVTLASLYKSGKKFFLQLDMSLFSRLWKIKQKRPWD